MYEALLEELDFHMARILVKVCPEQVWAASYNEVPFMLILKGE